MSSPIRSVRALQILDSRGNPTIEVEIALESGAGAGLRCHPVPRPGSSRRSSSETATRTSIGGKGVLQAVEHVGGEIAFALAGRDPGDQRAIDQLLIQLDGTDNKGRLGANAILGCSLAAAKAAAADAGVPLYRWIGGEDAHVLPVPMMNVVNGGAHAQNTLDLQEFMVVPAGADSFAEALEIGAETFHALRDLLHERGLATAVGDEGGFAPDLGSSEEAIDVVLEAAERAGHRDRVALALDPAATELWKEGRYRFERA